MSIVHVATSHAYDVLIDEIPLDDVGALAQRVSGGDVAFVVSDSNVAPLYLERAVASLERAGYRTDSFVFKAGEASKTLDTYTMCLRRMALLRLTRSSVVIALGGGVVGDLAGFAAATYMRGCRCIQIPTSLLACVDSSVGGKTAVDLPEGKNLVGAFFQPDAVIIDTSLIETLPHRYFIDGCAEIIKYGATFDADLFTQLERPLAPGDARLGYVIRRCVEIKRDVVQTDEYERGMRKLLNFGHTLGHAIERHSDFCVSHGFAVACGMVLVARACAIRGICSHETFDRIAHIVNAYGLGLEDSFDAKTVFDAALADKKRSGNKISVIGMRKIGEAIVMPLDLDEFKIFIEQAYS